MLHLQSISSSGVYFFFLCRHIKKRANWNAEEMTPSPLGNQEVFMKLGYFWQGIRKTGIIVGTQRKGSGRGLRGVDLIILTVLPRHASPWFRVFMATLEMSKQKSLTDCFQKCLMAEEISGWWRCHFHHSVAPACVTPESCSQQWKAISGCLLIINELNLHAVMWD